MSLLEILMDEKIIEIYPWQLTVAFGPPLNPDYHKFYDLKDRMTEKVKRGFLINKDIPGVIFFSFTFNDRSYFGKVFDLLKTYKIIDDSINLNKNRFSLLTDKIKISPYEDGFLIPYIINHLY